jgi:LPS sulfotransferase NodH
MPSPEADPRVVLVFGCGRSGTTLVYELLAAHPDTAWISTWTDRTGLPCLARLNRLFAHSDRIGRFYPPRPSEGYRTWDRAYPPSVAREGVLDAADLAEGEQKAMWRFVHRHCAATGSNLFVNKNTRNSRRIAMLRRVFPEAAFIHVHRNPLDTVSSLLRVAFWPNLPLWFRDGRCPRELCASPVEEAALAAELYAREHEAVENSRALVPAEGWSDISYERLVGEPAASLGPLLAAAGLEESAAVRERLATVSPRSVGIHARTLSAEQSEAAQAVLDAGVVG